MCVCVCVCVYVCVCACVVTNFSCTSFGVFLLDMTRKVSILFLISNFLFMTYISFGKKIHFLLMEIYSTCSFASIG